MKKLLFVLAVFCYTTSIVSAQVEDAVKVVNAVDELSPAAKAAADDSSIITKSCGKDGKVCYLRKGEGDAMNVMNWDVEQNKFVNKLDKEGKPVTCAANCAKTCSKAGAKTCSKSAAKTCSHAKGTAGAKTCKPGCTKACCASKKDGDKKEGDKKM